MNFYDNDFDKILEVESRVWEEFAGGTDNFYYQWFLFRLSKACGGPKARGYIDMTHYEGCLGGRPTYDSKRRRCPGK